MTCAKENLPTLLFFQLLTPPGLNILLLIVALCVMKTARWLSIALTAASIVILSIFSLPIVAQGLYESLNSHAALELDNSELPKASAIVVLGHGRTRVAPELGNINTVDAITLERLRYAAFLHKKLELPVLISGGRDAFTASPEAVLANHVMAEEFNVAPRWLETQGVSLEEKVARSAELLLAQDVKSILLVAHHKDMDRALKAFQPFAISVEAAPINIASPLEPLESVSRWTPSATALQVSQQALLQHILTATSG